MLDFDPWSPQFTANPYRVFSQLRENNPVYSVGSGTDTGQEALTYLSRYRDIAGVLRDSRFVRTLDTGHRKTGDSDSVDERCHSSGLHKPHLAFYHRYVGINLLEMEGQQHDRLRGVISVAFGPRNLATLAPKIEKVVADLLNPISSLGEVEFIENLAVPLPVHVISELLGWPLEHRDRLRPFSEAIVRLYEPNALALHEAQAEEATREFAELLLEVCNKRRVEPGSDLISQMVSAQAAGQISQDEVIGSAMMLLNAGHESSVNAAGNGLLALLSHPLQVRMLLEHPELMGKAVEEMLRFDAPLQFFHRYVSEDVELAGKRFHRGDKVGLLYGSANRDEDAFPQADRFILDRYPNRHLTFGRGVHHCIGAPLARMEMAILFRALLQKLPGLALLDEVAEFKPGLVFRGLKRLRLRWDAR